MTSPAYDIAWYIAVTLGKGALGRAVLCNTMLDSPSPDNQIAVFEYGGLQADLAMGDADPDALENPRVQIVVRNTDPVSAQSICYAIHKSLDGKIDVTINGTEYLFLRALQPPFKLEVDANLRVKFAFNLAIQRRRSA